MLNSLHRSFRLLATGPAADDARVKEIQRQFGNVPSEYLDLVRDATEIELQHETGQYIRIWGPAGCIEMDEGYGIRQHIPGAVPIGDDGGGHILFYQVGKNGFGLYNVGYGNLDGADATWIGRSLTELLAHAEGIDRI